MFKYCAAILNHSVCYRKSHVNQRVTDTLNALHFIAIQLHLSDSQVPLPMGNHKNL